MPGLEDVWIVEEREENERKVERAVRRKKFVEKMTLVVNLVLFIIVFGASIYHIDNKAKINELNSQNLALEKEVADLRSKINEKNVLISSQFSLESIYDIATKELGMVYPTAARVISLSSNRYFSLERREESLPAFVLDTENKVRKRK